MTRLRPRRGMTLVEITIVTALAVIVSLAFAQILGHFTQSVLRMRTRTMLDADSRVALEMIIPPMKRGIPGSTVVCGCLGAPCGSAACSASPGPVFSQIQFNTSESPYVMSLSTYTIFFRDGKLWLDDDLFGRTDQDLARPPRTIARNVVTARFQPNTEDPGLIRVTLEFEAEAGPKSKQHILLPDVAVRMGGE